MTNFTKYATRYTTSSTKEMLQREILSVAGLLQHATKIVRSGRTIVSHMYAAAAKPKKMHYFTWLNTDFHSDLAWWHVFLQSWNAINILCGVSNTSSDFTIYTHASGLWGCGACFSIQWLQWQWPSEWLPISTMAKELVPIVLSCAVWGPQLAALFRCDNTAWWLVLIKEQ